MDGVVGSNPIGPTNDFASRRRMPRTACVFVYRTVGFGFGDKSFQKSFQKFGKMPGKPVVEANAFTLTWWGSLVRVQSRLPTGSPEQSKQVHQTRTATSSAGFLLSSEVWRNSVVVYSFKW